MICWPLLQLNSSNNSALVYICVYESCFVYILSPEVNTPTFEVYDHDCSVQTFMVTRG